MTSVESPSQSAKPSESTVLHAAPALSRRGLTILLALMCVIPLVTITWLQFTMPPVRPGELNAEVALQNVPPANYYRQIADDRLPMPLASVVVKNTGDQPWTHINIRINRNYQIYEHAFPIEPGDERAFFLDRFVSRTGATLDVRLVQPRDIEIYARLPDSSRATFEQDF